MNKTGSPTKGTINHLGGVFNLPQHVHRVPGTANLTSHLTNVNKRPIPCLASGLIYVFARGSNAQRRVEVHLLSRMNALSDRNMLNFVQIWISIIKYLVCTQLPVTLCSISTYRILYECPFLSLNGRNELVLRVFDLNRFQKHSSARFSLLKCLYYTMYEC